MADKDYTIKVVTIGDPSGSDKVANSLDRVNKSARGTKDEAKEAGNAIDAFGKKGAAAQDAFEGLSRVANGGAGAIFGMAKAARALGEAFAANPVTASLGLVLALLPLIQKGFDLWVVSANKARDAMAGTGSATRAAAEGMKQIGEASERYIKAATTQAEQLAATYNKVTSAAEATLRRFKEIEQARLDSELAANEHARQQALGGAKSDEERAAINAKFDAFAAEGKQGFQRAVGDKELLALTQKGSAADEQRRKAEEAIGGASSRTEAARKAERAARTSGNPAAFGNALRAREQAEKDEAAVRGKFQPLLDQATNDQADVAAATKAFSFREQQARTEKQTTSITTARGTAATTSSNAGRQAELRATAEAAQARGDHAAQDRAVAELRGMRKAASELSKAVVDTAQTTAEELRRAARDLEKQKRTIKAQKESKAGS